MFLGADCCKMLTMDIANYSALKNMISLNNDVYIIINK